MAFKYMVHLVLKDKSLGSYNGAAWSMGSATDIRLPDTRDPGFVAFQVRPLRSVLQSLPQPHSTMRQFQPHSPVLKCPRHLLPTAQTEVMLCQVLGKCVIHCGSFRTSASAVETAVLWSRLNLATGSGVECSSHQQKHPKMLGSDPEGAQSLS